MWFSAFSPATSPTAPSPAPAAAPAIPPATVPTGPIAAPARAPPTVLTLLLSRHSSSALVIGQQADIVAREAGVHQLLDDPLHFSECVE
jgi:hypothetical protein